MMKRVFSVLGAILLTGIALLAGLEFGLRFIGFGDPVVYYTNLTYRFAPEPNQRVVRPGGKVITINERGLRATESWDAPADLRILFVGDSVTWGTSYVTDSEIFSERTCAKIEHALGLRATCGNAGVNAYGTDNMTRRIRFKLFDNEDWIVVVVLSGDAIRSLSNIGAGHWLMKKPTGALRASWEAATYASVRLGHILRGSNNREPRDRELQIAQQSLRDLVAVLREKQRDGKRILIAMTIAKEEIRPENEYRFTPLVREELARSGLPFLDLSPVIRHHFRPDFFVDNVHLAPFGNEIFAEAIAAHLVEAERRARSEADGERR